MKELILIGSGGCMRELLWQIERQGNWQVRGYVDVKPWGKSADGSISVGMGTYPYLGDDSFLLGLEQSANIAVCIGEPAARKTIAEKLLANPHLEFPNIILADAKLCPSARLGKGCIISENSRISTNVVLGDFVFFNLEAMVCHDGYVGSFTTLAPGAMAAGNVRIGSGCTIGMGTNIIQEITVGDNTITGAGAVIIEDVPGGITVGGVPARRIR